MNTGETALVPEMTGQDVACLAEFLLHNAYLVHGITRRALLFFFAGWRESPSRRERSWAPLYGLYYFVANDESDSASNPRTSLSYHAFQ